MASQWNHMGNDLLKVPIFQKTIERCHDILAKKGIDLKNILTTDDESIFENNVLNCMVGIGAVQIGMVNILREIGVEPDLMMGMSFGETVTGYADGCLTEEETILTAYYRGFVNSKGSSIDGQIAFVGYTTEELNAILPKDIDVAAHMDSNAQCVSGPRQSVLDFAEKTKEENRFTAVPNCAGIAFHSRYIAKGGTVMLAHLQSVIPQPKFRSKKWLSTSVLPENWLKPGAMTCSAEYYVNNYVGCVYLEEACRQAPKDCIILEIAPHCILRATMKNNFPEGTHITVSDKKRDNICEVFLEALRALSDNGVKINWSKASEVFGNNNL